MSGLSVFRSEFLDYVLSLSIQKDCPVNFGNMDFDYCLLFDCSTPLDNQDFLYVNYN